MFGRNRSPNADRPWREVEDLISGLAVLAEKRFSGREFYMWIDAEGCRMSLKMKGAEYSGRGSDPWECAKDLASNAGAISESVLRLASVGNQ